MGMFYFPVQKYTHVTKVSCFSVHLPFVLALGGFARLCEAFEGIGSLWDGALVWKVLEGFAGFGGFCEAMRSFERRGEALGGFGRC